MWVLGMPEKVPLKSALKTSKSGARISGRRQIPVDHKTLKTLVESLLGKTT